MNLAEEVTVKFQDEPGYSNEDAMVDIDHDILETGMSTFQIESENETDWRDTIRKLVNGELNDDELLGMAFRMTRTKPEFVTGWNGGIMVSNNFSLMWKAANEIIGAKWMGVETARKSNIPPALTQAKKALSVTISPEKIVMGSTLSTRRKGGR